MGGFFEVILLQPILNVFVFLYNVIPDLGVTIALVTLLIKVILYPLTSASIKAQKQLTSLQPKMEEIKQKYKGDQQMIAQETMKLYKENKVNPVGSCLPVLVQLPIFIALYWVLRAGISNTHFDLLYPFVKNPGMLTTTTFGVLDLAHPNYVLAVLAGLAQFWQTKMMIAKRPPKNAGSGAKDEDTMAAINQQMLYVMPVMSVIIGVKLPGGLTLYWFLSTLLTALQQLWLLKKHEEPKPPTPPVIDGTIVE